MFRYIPHKNNKHSWRTLLFIFFVVCASATGAYFVCAQPNVAQKDTTFKQVLDSKSAQIFPEKITVSMPDAAPSSVASPDQSGKLSQNQTPDPAAATLPPAQRSNNPTTRLEEAKKYTQPRILVGKYIDISLKYQNMVIFEDGQLLDSYVISSGKKGFETPVGTFKIENKTPRAWSKKFGLWMPWWEAFLPDGEMGIHELPEWPGGYKEGANHLGTPVSHGCVRLGVGPAKRVYDWTDIGTPVVIHF